MTRAAIFDLDDTLYAYEAFVHSGFRAVSHHVSTVSDVRAAEVTDFLTRVRRSAERGCEFQALCRAYGLAVTLIPTLLEVFRAHTPSVTLATGAARVLQTMRAAGWGLAVLTNGNAAVQRRKVHALGVEALVDCVLYAEEHAAGGKPAPAAFEAAVLRLGVAPARVVMVGNDLEADVRGAERAGLHAIHLHNSSGQPAGDPAGVTASSLADVPPLAESLIPNQAPQQRAPRPRGADGETHAW